MEPVAYQGLVRKGYGKSQLQQIIQETGLTQQQIMNYRSWLRYSTIFPKHTNRDGEYSNEEMEVLKKLGAYVRDGMLLGRIELNYSMFGTRSQVKPVKKIDQKSML